jgi:tRNA/tmRNA/rRNA uracil-C5-methylase (TrmA/RlmC/RlmD family)
MAAEQPSTRASARPRPSDELELEIGSLAQGGRGVARLNGYVVFVAGALPGDTVRVAVTKSKRNYAEARALEIVRPSPDRLPDRCIHGGEPCPGAPWQGLPYEQQLRHKSQQVDEALRRLGEFDPRGVRMVELHFFAGLSMKETAGELGLTERTAYREWRIIKSWLGGELAGGRSA